MKRSVEKCMQWVERDKKVIAPCSHLSYFPLVIAEAKQDMVYDEDENGYIDFLSSASSLNLGSGQPAVHAAVMDQIGKGTQYTIAYSYSRASIEYAERLTSVYPGGAEAKVCFGLCGSDGNDAAVKFARAYTGRPKIITFLNGYHGSTYGAASLTAVSVRARRGMGPFLPEVYSFPFFDTSVEDAIEHYGIVPDGIVLGKALGGGLPLGAFMARSEIIDALPAPAHLFTLSGSTLACRAGIAAFDYMCTGEFRQILAENTRQMQQGLEELCRRYPENLTGICGVGMSRGLAVTRREPGSGHIVPDADGTFKILYRAYEKGLLVISLGQNILRIQPPLNIRTENLRKGFEILAEAVEDYRYGRIPDDVFHFRQGW